MSQPAKVSIKYSDEELKVIFVVLKRAVEELPAPRLSDRLMITVLDRLRIKLIKRMLTARDEYTFTFELDEQMAFVIAFEDGWLFIDNNWAANILLSTFNKLHQKLQ